MPPKAPYFGRHWPTDDQMAVSLRVQEVLNPVRREGFWALMEALHTSSPVMLSTWMPAARLLSTIATAQKRSFDAKHWME